MRALFLLAPLVLAACVPGQSGPSGSEDFTSFCAGCHGVGGKGDGEVASSLAKTPADLTALVARNEGRFPTTEVMAKIWGAGSKSAAGQSSHASMPEFAALLESDLVPYDGGDGIYTPTPLRLVQIAEYLKAIQG